VRLPDREEIRKLGGESSNDVTSLTLVEASAALWRDQARLVLTDLIPEATALRRSNPCTVVLLRVRQLLARPGSLRRCSNSVRFQRGVAPFLALGKWPAVPVLPPPLSAPFISRAPLYAAAGFRSSVARATL
jgi:hypothetical protein